MHNAVWVLFRRRTSSPQGFNIFTLAFPLPPFHPGGLLRIHHPTPFWKDPCLYLPWNHHMMPCWDNFFCQRDHITSISSQPIACGHDLSSQPDFVPGKINAPYAPYALRKSVHRIPSLRSSATMKGCSYRFIPTCTRRCIIPLPSFPLPTPLTNHLVYRELSHFQHSMEQRHVVKLLYVWCRYGIFGN